MNKYLYNFGGYNTQEIKNLVGLCIAHNIDVTELLYQRPDAAPDALRFITTISPEKVHQIVPDAFADIGPDLAPMFSLEQLEAIGMSGDKFLKIAILLSLTDALKKGREDENFLRLLRYVYASPAWQL